MFNNDLKLALQSLRSTRWRSFFTTIGVVIGVMSVVTTVSIGIGIRQQITSQIKQFGADLITILPGENSEGSSNLLKRFNVLPSLGTGSFDEKDLNVVGQTKGVNSAVPISVITGNVVINGNNSDTQVIATTNGFPAIVDQSLNYGQFFTANPDGNDSGEAVVGETVANELFGQVNPTGRTLTIRGQTFTVQGVFNTFDTSPLTPIVDYNDVIFIPFDVGVQMTGGQAVIDEILAKPNIPTQTNSAANAISKNLLNAHGGEADYSVLQQKQDLTIADNALDFLTALVAAIAAISLIVGGIGIMNIMLVSVVERTHEIGVRKAVGATNRQILMQFIIESAILGLIGGIIGVALSLVGDLIIGFFSPIRPAITVPIVLIAIFMALFAGVLFGSMPAVKAAHKDPIESIRNE